MRHPPSRLEAGVTQASVTSRRHGKEPELRRDDWVIVEEPLQIRVAGDAVVVTMRTPGHDHELVAGYLAAEGWIRGRSDLGSIRHCDSGPDPTHNVVDVLPAPGTTLEERAPRRQLSTSACGLCGREQIDDLLARVEPIRERTRWRQSQLQGATEQLRGFQHNYAKTGGGHAAAVLDEQSAFLCVREDVGRHNAVDKVVGRLLLNDEFPTAGRALLVSGRLSFEIVQKAAMARFELVVGISAPSSLAITTAQRLGITLVGFARSAGYNVYSVEERLVQD
ncbi:MAG TPA: formate dehydrogenase accessory sulfurtransferase FdhD [Polyangiaceae bacterium]